MKVQYDAPTTEWFKAHPEAVIGASVCPVCGLCYQPSIGHQCPGEYAGANEELLAHLGITPKQAED